MMSSSSRIAQDASNTSEEWLAAYDLEKAFPAWESRRGTATSITQLTRREQQIANLFLEGCENKDIAKQLGIAHRTVKACFNRLYLRFGIRSGIKRVKLATFLYRSQLSSQIKITCGNNQPTGDARSSPW
jgi:DNA-binding NarL/FixJ family response regulator